MTIVSRISARTDPRIASVRVRGRQYHPAPPTAMAVRATNLWETLVNAIAPLGYEDETGFHFGVPAVTKTSH